MPHASDHCLQEASYEAFHTACQQLGIQIGSTKVFFKRGVHERLEAARLQKVTPPEVDPGDAVF